MEMLYGLVMKLNVTRPAIQKNKILMCIFFFVTLISSSGTSG